MDEQFNASQAGGRGAQEAMSAYAAVRECSPSSSESDCFVIGVIQLRGVVSHEETPNEIEPSDGMRAAENIWARLTVPPD